MRSFVSAATMDPVPASIVRLLSDLDRGRGNEEYRTQKSPEVLKRIASRARTESVIASSMIEGIVLPRNQAEPILAGRTQATERSGHELAGYQAALDDAYRSRVDPLSVPRLLTWHRMLFAHAGPEVAGQLKTSENTVMDRLPDGTSRERFRPISADQTPNYLVELCQRYETEVSIDRHHPLLLIAAATLDLLVVHPFEDGNGRVARVLTNGLLDRHGYRVCRYESIEALVARRRDEYYDALAASTTGWHDSGHSLWPWAEFLASILAEAYRRLDRSLSQLSNVDPVTQVRDWVRSDAPTAFSISQAHTAHPGLSKNAIRSALVALRDEGALTLEGSGRGSRWRVISTNDSD